MRHRRKGRTLGRNPSHQRALLRMLANALILTEADYEDEDNAPKVKGRIVTTVHKAKEVRPLVEKCVTLARKAQRHLQAAAGLQTEAERNSDAWRKWRDSDEWRAWNQAIAPAVALRRRALQILHDKRAVAVLFDVLGPRFEDRNGGYTRIVKLAKPRLGDAGARAILEFVGQRDRVRPEPFRPAFDEDVEDEETEEQEDMSGEVAADEGMAESAAESTEEPTEEAASDEPNEGDEAEKAKA